MHNDDNDNTQRLAITIARVFLRNRQSKNVKYTYIYHHSGADVSQTAQSCCALWMLVVFSCSLHPINIQSDLRTLSEVSALLSSIPHQIQHYCELSNLKQICNIKQKVSNLYINSLIQCFVYEKKIIESLTPSLILICTG